MREDTASSENLWRCQTIKLHPRPVPSETLVWDPAIWLQMIVMKAEGCEPLAPGKNQRPVGPWAGPEDYSCQRLTGRRQMKTNSISNYQLGERGTVASWQVPHFWIISPSSPSGMRTVNTLGENWTWGGLYSGRTWKERPGILNSPDQTSAPLKPAWSTAWPAFLGLPGFQRREPSVLQERAEGQLQACKLCGKKHQTTVSPKCL